MVNMNSALSNETLLLMEADFSNAKKNRSARASKRKAAFKAKRREVATNKIQYRNYINPGSVKKFSGIPCHPGKNPYKKYHSSERRRALLKNLREEVSMAEELMAAV